MLRMKSRGIFSLTLPGIGRCVNVHIIHSLSDLALGLGQFFFIQYIVPDDNRLSIKNNNLKNFKRHGTYPYSPPDRSLYRRCLPVNNIHHFEVDQNQVYGEIINVTAKSKMAVYLPERTTGITN